MNVNILLEPAKTEKSTKKVESSQFTFMVAKNASKGQIAQAVEDAFGVNVLRVNTVSIAGKRRKFGKFTKTLPDRKKAVVVVKKGQSIDLFEAQKKGRGRKKR